MRLGTAWAGWFFLAGALAFGADIPPQDLKNGGFIVYFRHAFRDAYTKKDERRSDVDNRGVCMPGTELNEKGRKEAERIARALAALHIPIERVYASTTCRTRQMAEILSPPNHEVTRALSYPRMYRDEADRKANEAGLKKLLAGPVPTGMNRILVSHTHVLDLKALGIPHEPREGDAVVLAPKPGGGLRFAGYLKREAWPNVPPARLLRR